MYIRIPRSIPCPLAIGLPHEIAHGSLRLTLSDEITKEQLDYVVDHLKEIVAKLRSMSPLYEDYAKNICHKYLKRRKNYV